MHSWLAEAEDQAFEPTPDRTEKVCGLVAGDVLSRTTLVWKAHKASCCAKKHGRFGCHPSHIANQRTSSNFKQQLRGGERFPTVSPLR